jgi:hypothetical protein
MRQLGGEMRSEAPASVNAPTIEQLAIACRHVDELRKAGCTENTAVRILELLADVYAKLKAAARRRRITWIKSIGGNGRPPRRRRREKT